MQRIVFFCAERVGNLVLVSFSRYFVLVLIRLIQQVLLVVLLGVLLVVCFAGGKLVLVSLG